MQHFNSHAHVERDVTEETKKKMSENFNSHAHVERDNQILVINKYTNISTHTLTWSVTYTPFNSFNFNLISTHTLTWSVTLCFKGIDRTLRISTHTLTWSVT